MATYLRHKEYPTPMVPVPELGETVYFGKYVPYLVEVDDTDLAKALASFDSVEKLTAAKAEALIELHQERLDAIEAERGTRS